jgi:D-alanine-D-alanine ligase-like ATP-grasp enzyme
MRYVLVVDHYSPSILAGLKKHATEQAEDYELVILTRQPEQYNELNGEGLPIEVIPCMFDNSQDIKEILAPFYGNIAAVICRGDKQVQFLRRLIPYLPQEVFVSSAKSLEIATNKRLMREAFTHSYPEITPKFVEIQNSQEESIQQVLASVPFPVIVKPAGLVSSLLIQSCANESELRTALMNTFGTIETIYKREERSDKPEVIVEEFLEGDFYSIDAYVLTHDEVYFCPPVAYIPAQKIGIDDFFLYKRFVPTKLTASDVSAANEATKKAIQAIGLTYSTAHVELIKTASGWKIIEIGPRVGRFRKTMYEQAYDIDHSYNDIAVHMGLKPRILENLRKYCSAYSIYPHHEGVLKELIGIEKLETDPSIYSLKIFARPGDRVIYAKNGGKACAEFIVAAQNKKEYDSLIEYIEAQVKALVDIEK